MLDTDFAILNASACGGLHFRLPDERPASESAQPSDALWSGTADTTAASAFVSFASRRLRLTIYWRRAGLVGLVDCFQLPYAHVMQLVSLAVLVPTSCICKPW